MPDKPSEDPEDEFRDMLREFLAGNSDIDASKLASAAGLPDDPALLNQLMGQLQNALNSSDDGINWGLAEEQAKALAASGSQPTSAATVFTPSGNATSSSPRPTRSRSQAKYRIWVAGAAAISFNGPVSAR